MVNGYRGMVMNECFFEFEAGLLQRGTGVLWKPPIRFFPIAPEIGS
jgi:hypothetical protein